MASRTLAALAACSIAIVSAQTPDNQCFWKAANQVVSEGDGWYACNNTATTSNGASLCCMKGSQCGEDSLCHFPSGSNGGSGWYLGGCTDGSYNDPVCPRACTGHKETWIQYNDTEQLWRCCGDDICTGTPSSESFQAIAPDQWSALPSQATTSASHSTTVSHSSTATATATAAGGNTGQNDNNGNDQGKGSTNGQDSDDSSGLSTGAQAGIGVGVAVVGLAIIAAIVFFCLRRRKNAKITKPTGDADAEKMMQHQEHRGYRYAAVPAYPDSTSHQTQRDYKQPVPFELNPEQRSELGAGMQSPQELAVNETRAELDNEERK